MSETLTRSTKDRLRLQVMSHLKHCRTAVVKAATAPGLNERQMYRVLRDRYQSQGDQGFAHCAILLWNSVPRPDMSSSTHSN